MNVVFPQPEPIGQRGGMKVDQRPDGEGQLPPRTPLDRAIEPAPVALPLACLQPLPVQRNRDMIEYLDIALRAGVLEQVGVE